MWERANVVAQYIEGLERPDDRIELLEWLRLASTDLRLWNRRDLDRLVNGMHIDERIRRDLIIALARYHDAIAQRARAKEDRQAARDALGPLADGVAADCAGIGKWGAREASVAARGQLAAQIVDVARRRSITIAPQQIRSATIAATLDSLDLVPGPDHDIEATDRLTELRLDYRTNEAVIEQLRRLAREHDLRVADGGGEFALRAAARVGRADATAPAATAEAVHIGATSTKVDAEGAAAAWTGTVGAGSGLESEGLAAYTRPGPSTSVRGDSTGAESAGPEVSWLSDDSEQLPGGAESDCTGTAQRWLVEYLYSVGAEGRLIEVLAPPGLAGYDWETAARANRNNPEGFPSLNAVLESLWEQRSASGRRGGAAIVHIEFDSRPYAHLVEIEIDGDAADFDSARASAMRRLRERYPGDLFVLAWLDSMNAGTSVGLRTPGGSELEISGLWGYMWDAEGAARHSFDPERAPQVFGQRVPLRPSAGMPDDSGGAAGSPADQLRFWARPDGTGVVLIDPVDTAVTSEEQADESGQVFAETRSAAQIVEDRLHVGWIGGPLVDTLLDDFRTDGALTITRSRDTAGRPVTRVVAPGGGAWFELRGRADAPAGFDGDLVLHLPIGPNTSPRIVRERMFGLLVRIWGDIDPADVAGAAVALSVRRLVESASALGVVRVALGTDDSGIGLCRIETQGIAGETPFVFQLRRRYDLLAPEGPQPQLSLEIETPVGPDATDADAAALLRELTTTFRTLWHGREFASAMIAAPGMVAQAPGGDRRVAARMTVTGSSGRFRSQVVVPVPDSGSTHPESLLAQHDIDVRTAPIGAGSGVVVRWNHRDGTIATTGTSDDVLDAAGQPVAYMDRREIPIFGVIPPDANWETVQRALADMMRYWPDAQERANAEAVARELSRYAFDHGTGPLVITTVGLGGHWAVRMQMDVRDASVPILPTTYAYPTSWHLRDGSVTVVLASGSAQLARMLSGHAPAAPQDQAALPATEAHRGGRGLLPENSIPAFAYSIETGVDAIELDGQTTADNVIVVTHGLDPGWTRDTRPVVPGDPMFPYVGKKVSDLTWAQIQTIDIGVGNPKFPGQQAIPGTTMPSLEQACILVAGSGRPMTVAYEAKVDPSFSEEQVRAHVVAVIEIMTRHGISYSLRSFDWRVLRYARELVPDVDRIALTSAAHTTDDWMGRGRGLSRLARARAMAAQAGGRPRTPGADLPARARQAGATAIAPHHTMVTAELMRQAAAAGLPVMPWTVNDDADMRRMIDLGVAAICTDYPDRLQALLTEYRDRTPDTPWAEAEQELLSHGAVTGEQRFGLHHTYRITFEDGTIGAYTPSGATSSAAGAQLREPPSGSAARAVFVYRLATRLGVGLIPPTALWTGSRGPGVLSLVHPDAEQGRAARDYRGADRFTAGVFQFVIGETDGHPEDVLTRRRRPLLVDNKNTLPLGPESFAPEGFTSDIRSPFVDSIVGVRIPRSVLRLFDALTPEFILATGARLGVEPEALSHLIRRLSEVRATGRITPGMLATALSGQPVAPEVPAPSATRGEPSDAPATASATLLERDPQTDRILDPGSASADQESAQRALDILQGDPESDAAQPDSPRTEALEVYRRWNMVLREQEQLDRALIRSLLLLFPQHLADSDIPDLVVRSEAIELRIERGLAEQLTRPGARFGPLRGRQLVELIYLRNGALRARQLARIGHPRAPEVQVVVWAADLESVSGIRRVAYIFGDPATATEVDWHFFGGRGGWGSLDTYLSRTRNRHVAMQRRDPDRRAISVAWVYQTRSVGPGNARQALRMLVRDVERFAATEAAIRGPAGAVSRNNLVLHRISPLTAAEVEESGPVAAEFGAIVPYGGSRRRVRERAAALGAGVAARVSRGPGLVVPPQTAIGSAAPSVGSAIRAPGSDTSGLADREPEDPDPLPRDPRTGMPIPAPVDDRNRALAREVAAGWPPTAARPTGTVETRAQVRVRVFAAAEYWHSLDKAHRTAALWVVPDLVVLLGAAAPAVVDDAWRLIIVERMRILRERRTLDADELTELRNHETTQQALAQIDEMAIAVHPAVPVPTRYLIDYDPNAYGGKGKAVIVFRTPGQARPSRRPESVSVYVPGVGTNLEKLMEKAEFARNQYESTMVGADDDFATASIAWLGYDAPGTMKEGTDWRRARAGADRLRTFLFEYQAAQEFQASRAQAAAAHIHLIGHSYGSTTASFSGLGGAWEGAVTTFTILGSPGAAAARHAGDYRLPPGRVFAGGDWRDKVTWWSAKLPGQPGHTMHSAAVGVGALLLAGVARGSLGRDPLGADFGAIRIRAGFSADYGTPAEIHRGYLRFADSNTRTPTESLANTGRIAREEYDAVTIEEHRPSSARWSQRIDAWRAGDPAQRREVLIDDDTSGYDPPEVAGDLAHDPRFPWLPNPAPATDADRRTAQAALAKRVRFGLRATFEDILHTDSGTRADIRAKAIGNALWWAALTPREMLVLVKAGAYYIANGPGIAITAPQWTDFAARWHLQETLAQLQARIAPGPQEIRGLAPDERILLRSLLRTRGDLRRAAAVHPSVPTPAVFILAYDPRAFGGHGRLVMALGDPRKAKVRGRFVPGVKSDVQRVSFVWIGMRNLYEMAVKAGRRPEEFLCVAWYGYETPGAPGRSLREFAATTLTPGFALAGARLLSRDVLADNAAWLLDPEGADAAVTRVNVAHSYGSTTHGHAAAGGALAREFDYLVLIGSPGIPAANAAAFGIPADHVLVGAFPNDPVTIAGADEPGKQTRWPHSRVGRVARRPRAQYPQEGPWGLGMDPTHESWGARLFATDTPRAPGVEFPSHREYLAFDGWYGVDSREPTLSLWNIALLFAGRPDDISEAPHRTGVDDHGAHVLLDLSRQARHGFRRSERWPDDPQRGHTVVPSGALGPGDTVAAPGSALRAAAVGAVGELLSALGSTDAGLEDIRALAGDLVDGSADFSDGDVVFFAQAKPSGIIGGRRLELGVGIGPAHGSGGPGSAGDDGSSGGDTGTDPGGPDADSAQQVEPGRSGEADGELPDDADVVASQQVEPGRSEHTDGGLSGDADVVAAKEVESGEADGELSGDADVVESEELDPEQSDGEPSGQTGLESSEDADAFSGGDTTDDHSGEHPSADPSWHRTILPANRHVNDIDRGRAVRLWTWVYIDTPGRWPTLSAADVDLLVHAVPERICGNVHVPPDMRRMAYLLMLARALEDLERLGEADLDTFEQEDRLEDLGTRGLPTLAGALEIADGFAGTMSFYPEVVVLSLDVPVDGPSRRASIIGFGAVSARPMRPGDQLIVHVFGKEPGRRNAAQQTHAARMGVGISGVDPMDAVARIADYHRTAAAESWNLGLSARSGPTRRPEPDHQVISVLWHAPGIAPDQAHRSLASDLVSMVGALSGSSAVSEGEIPEVILLVHGPAVPTAMRAGARAQRAGITVRIAPAGPQPLPALLSQPTRNPAAATRTWLRLLREVTGGMRADQLGGTDFVGFRAAHTARRWGALDPADREEITWGAPASVVASAGVDAQARDVAYRVSLEYERDRLRVVQATIGLSGEQQGTLVLLELRTALVEVVEGVAAGLPGHPKALVASRDPVAHPERGLPMVMFGDVDFVDSWVVFVGSSASVRDGIAMAAERYSAEPDDEAEPAGDGESHLATIAWSIPDGMVASEAMRCLVGDLAGLAMARATEDDPFAEGAMPEIRLVVDGSAAPIASEIRADTWLSDHATIAGYREPPDGELRRRCLEFIRRVAEDLDIPPGHLDGGATVRELDAALPTAEVPRAYPFVPVALPTGAESEGFLNVLGTVFDDMVPDGTAADTVVLVTHRAGDTRNHITALTVVDDHLFIADGGRRGGMFTYAQYWEATSPSELTEPPVILVLARYYLDGRPVEVPEQSRAQVDPELLERVRDYLIEGDSWAGGHPASDHLGRSVRWDPDTGAVTVTGSSGTIGGGSPDSVAWVESAEIPIDRGLGQGAAAADSTNFTRTVLIPIESELRSAILYCVWELVEYAHLYGAGPLVHTALRLDHPRSGPQRAFALRLSDFGGDMTRAREIILISQAEVRLHNGTLYVVVADSPEAARILLPVEAAPGEVGTNEPHPMVPAVGQAMDDLLHASGRRDEGEIVRLCTVATELVGSVSRRFPGAVVLDAQALPATANGTGSMRLGVRVESGSTAGDSALGSAVGGNYTGAAQERLARYLDSVGADGSRIDVLPPPGPAGYDWTVVARANRMSPEDFATFEQVLASLWEQRSASGRRGGAAMVHMEFESLGLANMIEVEIREQDGDFAAARAAAMWRLRESYPDDPLFAGPGWFVVSGVWAYVVDAEGAARHSFDPEREEPVSFGFTPMWPSS
ncbi:alpha/beta hydrolase [Nocardia alni]|uniref:alpha/beta hydrolase n=1 Tax=Nocardia alni TaxID=2815723 RepID=UPI001C21618B|nr:alpha/beta hydrolase [Nocardia alni]